MAILEDILKRINPDLTYEELSEDERSVLMDMTEALQQGTLTINSLKVYIRTMREGVTAELTKPDLDPKQDLFLKARLRNYVLLETFLEYPERAKEAVDKAIEGMKKARNK